MNLKGYVFTRVNFTRITMQAILWTSFLSARRVTSKRKWGVSRWKFHPLCAKNCVWTPNVAREHWCLWETPILHPLIKKKCYHTSHMESARRMRIKRTRRTEQPYHVFPCWKKRGMIFPHFQKIRKYLLQKKWLTIISVHVRNTYVKVDKKLIGVRNRGLSGWTLPLTK